MNAALLSLAEIVTIQKFTHVTNMSCIIMCLVVRITQLATMHDGDLHYRVSSSPLILGHHGHHVHRTLQLSPCILECICCKPRLFAPN